MAFISKDLQIMFLRKLTDDNHHSRSHMKGNNQAQQKIVYENENTFQSRFNLLPFSFSCFYGFAGASV